MRPTLLVRTTAINTVLHLIPFEEPLKHPDVIQFPSEEENLTIDLVRELQSRILQKPYQAEFVVYLLQRVDAATTEAQQALLKMLEEPPKHIQFILLAEHPHVLLPTILSRVTFVPLEESQPDQASPEVFLNLLKQSLPERLTWAGKFSKIEEASREVATLISSATTLLEDRPSLSLIQNVRVLNQTFEYIQKRVNPRLSLEWCMLHLAE